MNIAVFSSGCVLKQPNDYRDNFDAPNKSELAAYINEGQNLSENITSDLKDIAVNENRRTQIKVNIAIEISNDVIKLNLHEIDLNEIETYDDYIKMANDLNLAIKIINDKTGTSFEFLEISTNSYDRFMLNINRYSPLIDNYNDFIRTCYNLDPSDETSVDNLYIKGITFAAEATLIFGGAFYGTAFAITGTLARTVGITKVASICGPCVSAAMSSTHWFIRNSLTETTTKTIDNALSSNYSNLTISGIKDNLTNYSII